MTAPASLPDTVGVLPAQTITWTVDFPDMGLHMGFSSGPHKIYRVYGQRIGHTGTEFTETRLNWSCTAASERTGLINIADGIYGYTLGAQVPQLAATDVNDGLGWLLLRPEPVSPASCRGLARLMTKTLGILGVPSEINYVYASTDADCVSQSDNAPEARTCAGGVHGDEKLWYYSAGVWNWYECVCKVAEGTNHKYYALKTTAAVEPVDILRAVAQEQAWRYAGEAGWTVCAPPNGPGPHPVPLP